MPTITADVSRFPLEIGVIFSIFHDGSPLKRTRWKHAKMMIFWPADGKSPISSEHRPSTCEATRSQRQSKSSLVLLTYNGSPPFSSVARQQVPLKISGYVMYGFLEVRRARLLEGSTRFWLRNRTILQSLRLVAYRVCYFIY